ncbi:MAG TPA: CGNR zinc finger domain-containing protein [Pseudonocardiaceae bacterium]|jgi:predicted RNA-binding Zn ribbon-like protein
MTVPGPLPFGAQAPAGVRLIIDFVNSRPVVGQPDLLGDPATASAYLRQCGLPEDFARLDSATLRGARDLRDALVDVLGSNPGDPERLDGWQVVNDLAAAAPLTVTFRSGPSAVLAPADDAAHPVVGRLVADVHAAIAADQWTRLHLCANDACRVGFYDASRSRTQRWHSYESCGNRVNVAAHRKRRTT